MEWDQGSGQRTKQALETQQSYETEWDMVNTVSFKKRPFSNTECESSAFYPSFSFLQQCCSHVCKNPKSCDKKLMFWI